MSQGSGNNTPDNVPKGEVASWIVIFVLMFMLPPVGIILLILKLRGYAKPVRSPADQKASSGKQHTDT